MMTRKLYFIRYVAVWSVCLLAGCFANDSSGIPLQAPTLLPSTATNTSTSIVPTITALVPASATPEMYFSGTIAMIGPHRTHLSLRLLNLEDGSIQDITGMGYNSLSWSPDGQWIAFNGGVPETQRLDIFVVKSDGTEFKRMTNSSSGEGDLSWSPNGKFIVYSYSNLATTFPESDLALLDVNETQTFLLTSTKGSEHHPAWSPNGRQIAYLFSQENLPSELWVMDFESKSSKRILLDASISGRKIDWSPNGQWIAFISTGVSDYCGDIYVVEPDGSKQSRLTNLTGCATALTWSPDGEYLAFVGKDSQTSKGWKIYIMDDSGGNIVSVTDEEKLRIDDIEWNSIVISK